VDEGRAPDFDWYYFEPEVTMKRDGEIKEEIKDELFWSPFVDADQVFVRVEEGVATLTGTVDSWTEYNAATENAYEGGATKVNNQLAAANY
jgi:osmotically-inducible protein OsmY